MKRDELYKQIEKGIAACTTSERYLTYLAVMSRFHKYSFANTICIACQDPAATQVAGYHTWQTKFKRYVKKGAKAIYILAPIKKRNEDDEEEIVAFKAMPVYDVRFTAGTPLPTLADPLTGSVNSFSSVIAKLKSIAKIPIKEVSENFTALGCYDSITSTISIRKGLAEAQYVKTLVHEIAHSRMHSQSTATRISKEVEAESVAYIFCQYLNVDSSAYSFEYLTAWSGGNTEILRDSFERIYSTSQQLIKEYEEVL